MNLVVATPGKDPISAANSLNKIFANTCNDWTDATSDYQGTQGDTDGTAAGWTELGSTAPCNFVRSLYCFADVDLSPPVIEEDSIPSLSLFGLVILLALLAGTGVFAARRQRG